MKSKVLVGMSGGIDSSMVAVLLQQAGYEVEGVYMKLHDKAGYHEANFAKVQNVAAHLDIKAHFVDLSDDFRREVYDYFVSSYKDGLTPNPCIMCNRAIKFGKLIEFAESIGADFLATGHYVRCDGSAIYEGIDESKDQSYFLARIDKSVLPKLIFPLGDWRKEDVKAHAQKYDFLSSVVSSKESTEICFVENSYTDVLKDYMKIDQEGEVLNTKGEIVGTHKGYMHYTVGKRRGFFVNGAHDPHFVLQLKPETNQIIVGTKEELEVNIVELKELSLLSDINGTIECQVKVRYRTQAVPASVTIDGNKAYIQLHESVFGVAKGQVAALYDQDRLLGGGIII